MLKRLCSIFILGIAILQATQLCAQTTSGLITGAVTDPSGAVVPDAEIDVRDRLELALVPAHPKRQPCEVVWRRGNVYGIRFLF